MSGINDYISKALNSSTSAEASEYLLQSEPLDFPVNEISRSIIPALQKIQKTHSFKVFYALLKIYSKLTSKLSRFQQSDQILILKEVHYLASKVKDCPLSNILIDNCCEFITSSLAQNTEISSLFDLPDSIDSKLADLVNNIKTGLRPFEEFMGELGSTRLQYWFIETRFEGFLLAIEKHLNEDLAIELIKFIEKFLFRSRIPLYLSGTVEYSVASFNLNSKLQKISRPLFKFIDLLSLFEVRVLETSIKVLHILWESEDLDKEPIFDMTKLILTKISTEGQLEYQKVASSLLYLILNSNCKSSFKSSLEQIAALRPLLESDFYRPWLEQSSLPESFLPSILLPIKSEIPAGESQSIYLSVDKPGTLLIWSFNCPVYDIGFKVQEAQSSSVLVPETRVKCEEVPSSGHLVINQAGLIEITWINSYSWLHSKQVLYKIALLEPAPLKPKTETPLVQAINESHVASLVEVGVWIRQPGKIQVLCQGGLFEISSLRDLYETLDMVAHGKKFNVGVVGKGPVFAPKLKVESLLTCVDVNALVLNGFMMHGPNSVIGIVIDNEGEEGGEEGTREQAGGLQIAGRIAVGVHKTVVYSEESKNIVEDISKLLNVFGHAFVLVAGGQVDLDVLKKLERMAEAQVNVDVFQQSHFRLANDLLLDAAAKLMFFFDELEGNSLDV